MGACKNKVRVNCGLNHIRQCEILIDIEQQQKAVDRYQTCFLQLLTGGQSYTVQSKKSDSVYH